LAISPCWVMPPRKTVVSVEAGEAAGFLLTMPVAVEGAALHINADCRG